MTRGKGILVTNRALFVTDEFNGDMYPTGFGKEFAILVSKSSVDTFIPNMKKFNLVHHNYEDFAVTKHTKCDKCFDIGDEEIIISFSDYFECWFSDYLFIKNDSVKK